jgi:hypothetical protein
VEAGLRSYLLSTDPKFPRPVTAATGGLLLLDGRFYELCSGGLRADGGRVWPDERFRKLFNTLHTQHEVAEADVERCLEFLIVE